jgi:hypothetical protein
MAILPAASTTIDDEAGALAGGTGYAVVVGCVQDNDDITPRVFTSTASLIDQHGYSPAVDYCALLGRTTAPASPGRATSPLRPARMATSRRSMASSPSSTAAP